MIWGRKRERKKKCIFFASREGGGAAAAGKKFQLPPSSSLSLLLTHRQGSSLLRGLGHRRRRARARPAAHPGGDEDQIRSRDRASDVGGRLLRGRRAERRVAARAEPAGELGAELELVEAGGGLEGLGVGVDGPELDALRRECVF